jgi:predicted 3-demethylubiquinone-9 3-methyltransferase (glyoxalase superfamily)
MGIQNKGRCIIMKRQKIVPHLWFENQAEEAVDFYTKIFKNSQVNNKYVIKNTPSGDVDLIEFSLLGYDFAAISAGSYFKPNLSISFMINFDTSQDPDARNNIDQAWKKLSDGGKVFMPIDEYAFSERYGWIQDKYGFSWQLIYTDQEGEERPPVMPSFMFVGDFYNKAEEATDFYISIFKNSKRGLLVYYSPDPKPDRDNDVMFTDFKLENQWFVASDSPSNYGFQFNEAISFIINCRNQEEINYFWDKLSASPESEQCGWVKDSFGVSWQIVPENLNELMAKNSEEINNKILDMKKIIIADLEK